MMTEAQDRWFDWVRGHTEPDLPAVTPTPAAALKWFSDEWALQVEYAQGRFRIPDGSTAFTDLIRGEVSIPHDEVDDWVLVRRGGGMPTYNFTVVCDDLAMGITHVFRGEEHLVNTPKQLLLYAALGAETPAFGHLPLLLGKDRRKLSKRSAVPVGAESIISTSNSASS